MFGDGLTGRVPRPDRDVSVGYTVGGGRGGNGGTTANWVPAGAVPAAVTAANPVRAEGGADPETVPEARRRAAAALGEVTRAVTAEDYVTLARTTPGVAVARAHAALGEHPGFPCSTVPGAVTVHLVPAVPRPDPAREDFVAAPLPDPGMLCAVAARLEQARLLTSEVFVRAPATATWRCAPTWRAAPPTAPGSPPCSPGRCSASSTRWWGRRPGGLAVRAAAAAPGPAAGRTARAGRPRGRLRRGGRSRRGAPVETCREVPLGPGELPVLRALRTRIVPAPDPGEGLV